jgi:hypothetical protein
LKYAAATAAVVGASALGFDYLLKSPVTSPSQTSTSSTAVHEMAPPVIGDFQWQPTRVVNDKVYEANVSFDVESSQPIISANATLRPFAPTIPARAYPPEDPVSLTLNHLPQPSRVTTYSATVANLKGGKRYALDAQAANTAGTQTANFETPYIREFENTAGRDDKLVGAIYLSWWENPCQAGWFCHWDEVRANYANGATPLGTPLLGLYDSTEPLVVAKHIDWATSHGIDLFFLEFFGTDSAPKRFAPLLTHPMVNQVRFAVNYYTAKLTGFSAARLAEIDFNDPAIYSQLESDLDYVAENYFSHPSYLRFDGRPVFQLYFTFQLKGDISPSINKLRSHMKELGYDIYLIGDQVSYGDEIDLGRLRLFDAVSSCSDPLPPIRRDHHFPISVAYDEYSRWQDATRLAGIELVPFAYPGYDDSYLTDRPQGYGLVPKNADFLESTVKASTHFLDRHRLMGIDTFNDWGEGTYIEPSVEDGFTYLQTLRDTLAGQ